MPPTPSPRSWPAPPTAGDLRLNIGCGEHYAPGWTNTDLIHHPVAGIRPDIITPVGEPLPFADGTASHIYVGHVLEHIPWDDVHGFLLDIGRVATTGAIVCVVGPDVRRALNQWKAGNLNEATMLDAILENESSYQSAGMWPGARHQWNCHEARVLLALDHAGLAGRPVPIDSAELDPWPVVSRIGWQFAILATNPGHNGA